MTSFYRLLYLLSAIVFLSLDLSAAESSVKMDGDRIVMWNSFIVREFSVAEGFHTVSFRSAVSGIEYSSPVSIEFSMDIDGVRYDGRSFGFSGYEVTDFGDCKMLEVILDGNEEIEDIVVRLRYWIYDDSPAVRKQIELTNKTGRILKLENLDVESLYLVPEEMYMTNIYANYGTNITRIPYVGDCYDPAVLVYNEIHKEGILLGNEAPGVLKRTSCYEKDCVVNIGMGRSGEDYPFRTYLEDGKSFVSPCAFIIFSSRDKWQDCFELELGDFVREHLGISLFERNSYPLFFYCTWIPFMTNISDSLVMSLADHLSQTGADVLIIDDGWYDCLGDYNNHPEKFPGGMQAVCRYIRSKGLIPGMWFSLSTISRDSEVFRDHPEWAVTAEDGIPANLHNSDSTKVTMSLCSGWYDYILGKLRHYIRTCRLGYVKLDFAMAASAYRTDAADSGDYSAKNGYIDRESSFWSLYQAAIYLFDALKSEFPDLIVDCTFELWGKYHLVDYALLQHADVDWLTNYEFPAPEGPVSIRQINHDRSRVVPVQTMMVGNQLIDSDLYQFTFLSLASGVQLMCGDPRNLDRGQKKWLMDISGWLERMDEKYSYTEYAYRSDIFGRPTVSGWDGCYRFNPDKQGGVLFFYRSGSLTDTEVYPLILLEKEARYRLSAPDGSVFGVFSGADLLASGIEIHIEEKFGAVLLEIEKVD